MPKDDKTNVMRLLDQRRIPYTPRTYPHQEGVAVDGLTVAQALGLDPETVFKTLLARGASGGIVRLCDPRRGHLGPKKSRQGGEGEIG